MPQSSWEYRVGVGFIGVTMSSFTDINTLLKRSRFYAMNRCSLIAVRGQISVEGFAENLCCSAEIGLNRTFGFGDY